MKSRRWVQGSAALGLALATSCVSNTVGGEGDTGADLDAGDGRPDRLDASGDDVVERCDPTRPFDAPVALTINSPMFDAGLRLSADEKTGYFYSNRGGDGIRIYRTTRADVDSPFDTPEVLGEFEPSSDGPWGPAITPDGLTLVVISLNGANAWDLYTASRRSTTASFGTPVVIPSLSAPGDDLFPLVSADGSSLYFKSGRASADFYVSTRAPEGTFGPAVPVPLAESGNNLALSPDERTMFFSHFDADTSLDIYVTTRPTKVEAFGPVTPVPELNTADEDSPSWLSADGCELYLGSYRNGNSDLFVARRPL